MIYQLLRFPLLVLFFVFYKRIYIHGNKHIPKQAPTIVASNHSTAFMEQILVAGLQKRSTYFWAGAASFDKNPLFPFIFKQSHVIPIVKREAGIEKMKQNKHTFESSKNIILEGKMLYISPEGISTATKKLMPFKTGTARLALMAAAENDFEQDVFILPTGVNYTYPRIFRSEVIISFGAPINVKHYKKQYQENPILAAKTLTEDLKNAVKKEVVNIENIKDFDLVEQQLVIHRNEFQHDTDAKFSHNEKRLALEQAVTNNINDMPMEEKLVLKEKSKHYFQLLEQHQLDDHAVSQKGQLPFLKVLKAVAFSPLALIGWLAGLLPVSIARSLRNKYIENLQFRAPMAMVFSFITWFVYTLVIGIVGCFFVGWKAFLIPPVLAFLQYLAFVNKDDWTTIRNLYQFSKLRKSPIFDELISKRAELTKNTML